MTVAEFQVQQPGLHAEIFRSGELAGLEAGKSAALAAISETEQYKLGHTAGLAEGAANEQKRIQAIDLVADAGYEDIVKAAKGDVSTTAEQVAMRICVARKARIDAIRAGVAADGAEGLRIAESLRPAGDLSRSDSGAAGQFAQNIIRDQAAKTSGRRQ